MPKIIHSSEEKIPSRWHYHFMKANFSKALRARVAIKVFTTVALVLLAGCDVGKVLRTLAVLYARMLEDKGIIEALVRDLKAAKAPVDEVRTAYFEAAAAQRSYFEVIGAATMAGDSGADLSQITRIVNEKTERFVAMAAHQLGLSSGRASDVAKAIAFPNQLHSLLTGVPEKQRLQILNQYGRSLLWLGWEEI